MTVLFLWYCWLIQVFILWFSFLILLEGVNKRMALCFSLSLALSDSTYRQHGVPWPISQMYSPFLSVHILQLIYNYWSREHVLRSHWFAESWWGIAITMCQYTVSLFCLICFFSFLQLHQSSWKGLIEITSNQKQNIIDFLCWA